MVTVRECINNLLECALKFTQLATSVTDHINMATLGKINKKLKMKHVITWRWYG